MIETLIQELRNGIDGEVSDKSRVTDHLLDLRLAAAGEPALLTEIDETLMDIPGRTTVANGWWLAVLDQLERSCETVAVG